MNHKNRELFSSYLGIILKRRRFVVITVCVIVIIAIIISLLIPPTYTATATLLPPTYNLEGGGVGSLIAAGALSRFMGGFPGLVSPSHLYANIMRSRTVQKRIIEKYDLLKIFKVKMLDDAYKELNRITKINISPEGIISISVTHKNKILAADIANSYGEELDKFNREAAMTFGKKYRIFIEQRLKATVDSLHRAEECLKEFQRKYRTVALDIEMQKAVEIIAKLKTDIILR